MENLDPQKIAERIKGWLKDQFGSIDEGARKLGKTPENLRNSVLKGKTLPSTEFMTELIKWGADYKWIIFGDIDKVGEPQVEYKVKKLENEVKELKQENEQLRSSLSQITSLSKAAEYKLKKTKKRKT